MQIKKILFLSWGHVRFQKKFGPDRFNRFDVYRFSIRFQKLKVKG